MKKIKILLLGIICLIIPNMIKAAGSASLNVAGSVEVGKNVTATVYISNTAAWNIKISGAGSTSNCYKAYADVTADGNNTNRGLTITCKATTPGTITFTVSGDITSADGANRNVSLTKNVTVTPPREKETINTLNSLSVSGYNLTPAFNENVTEYSVMVPPTVNSVVINAQKRGMYATVAGTGEKNITEGDNIFIITVTSETGVKKEYKINVSVIDENPIKITIENEEYTIIKNKKNLVSPIGFTENTLKINNFDIPSFRSDINNLDVLGVKNKDNKIMFAVKKEDNYYLFNENKSNELFLYITEKELDGYESIELDINGRKYSGYKIDDRFSLVYAMNLKTGKECFYKYDKEDNTFQTFNENKESVQNTSYSNIYLYTTIGLTVISIGLLGAFIFTVKNKKNNI